MTTLPPGSTIGVLGGGQLGRMLALAAARLGLKTAIYTDRERDCASEVAAFTVSAPYDDLDAVKAFAGRCDVVTYEFENVPAETARAAALGAPLRPGVAALDAAQDRVREKRFVREAGAQTVAFAAVDGPEDFERAGAATGFPAILKTRRFGYDGKGQARVETPADLTAAFSAIGERPCVLEARATFVRELSILAARGVDGAIAAYPLAENRHADGILRESRAPAAVSPELASEAARIAASLLEALDYVGVLAVELFELSDGGLLVNEIAPRVHNTGHWTMDACSCSQFEQHIRAVAGWPLGDPAAHASAVMTNLIGEDAAAWARLSAEPGACLHLYGKGDPRPGRKMGHVNRLGPL